jgi:hypothetical protein
MTSSTGDLAASRPESDRGLLAAPVSPTRQGRMLSRVQRRDFALRAAFLYVDLWVVEGAIRKWIAPGASNALYLARDVLAVTVLVAVWSGSTTGRQRTLAYKTLAACFLITGILLALTLPGREPLPLAALGVSNYLAPILGFGLISCGLAADPAASWALMRRIRSWVLVEVVLVVLQTLAPADSFLNHTVNGDQPNLTTSEGIVRATGTFTAPIGLSGYVALAVAVQLALLLPRQARPGLLDWVCLACALVVMGVSGSRLLLLEAALPAAVVLLCLVAPAASRARALIILVAGVVVFLAVQTFLPTVLNAFATRISVAQQTQDPVARLVETVMGFWGQLASKVGDGPGSHSSASAQLIGADAWVEDEGSRWVAELGVVGFVANVVRQVVGFVLLAFAFVAPFRGKIVHACLAALAVAVVFVTGSPTAQPSVQGLAAVVLALLVARYPRR